MSEKYTVNDPENTEQLADRINKTGSAALTSVALELIVTKELDELAKRRGDTADEKMIFNVETMTIGNEPFLIGYIGDNPFDVARLEAEADDSEVGAKPLRLTVHRSSVDSDHSE